MEVVILQSIPLVAPPPKNSTKLAAEYGIYTHEFFFSCRTFHMSESPLYTRDLVEYYHPLQTGLQD